MHRWSVIVYCVLVLFLVGCKDPTPSPPASASPPAPPEDAAATAPNDSAKKPTTPTKTPPTTPDAACDLKALSDGFGALSQQPLDKQAAPLRLLIRDACSLPKGLLSLVLTNADVAQWTPADAKAEQDALVARWEAFCPGSRAKLNQNAGGPGPALALDSEQLAALYDSCPPASLVWLSREEFSSSPHGGLLVIAAAPLHRWLLDQPTMPAELAKGAVRALIGLPPLSPR